MVGVVMQALEKGVEVVEEFSIFHYGPRKDIFA
uniref:Uncharacterized protein n=1 Tax=Rhizophora mucronata TaxID=61149 RepID=A0A2P2NXZ5_RHIMU